MLKKILSLSLCLIMLLGALAGCAKKDERDKGAYIAMYLTDQIYDFDPAHAYGNESALRIVSLMFDNLFVLNEKGQVKKSLAKEYKYVANDNVKEYKMTIVLNDTCWSDGIPVSANDVVYSWKRILDVANSFEAASLLYDVKNARAAKDGECSIDDVRIYSAGEKQVEIFFEGPIDPEQFLYNLTCHALAPLREDIVKSTEKEDDWAKKPSAFVGSGPFRLREVSYDSESAGLILERNSYYYRNIEKDDLDKAVTPYRILVDYTMEAEDIKKAYNEGSIFYVGDIPMELRGEWKDLAEVKDAMSTHTYYLNENAVIREYSKDAFKGLTKEPTIFDDSNGGKKLFAIPEVRLALSLAIDRQAIADKVVFARAATGLIPYGVFDTDAKTSFREANGNLIVTSANMEAAKAELAKANITASKYMFTISVPSYDEVHVEIAEMVKASWEELGFHVAINKIKTTNNTDLLLSTKEPLDGVKDDIFAQNVRAGMYEVAAIDYVAYTPDALSMLAPFAKGFTGGAASKEQSMEFNIPNHITGYNDEAYDAKIKSAFEQKTDLAAKAAALHEAEKALLEDMPVIPIIFNQTATLVNKDLSKIKYTYYGTPIFTKAKLKDYEIIAKKYWEEEENK